MLHNIPVRNSWLSDASETQPIDGAVDLCELFVPTHRRFQLIQVIWQVIWFHSVQPAQYLNLIFVTF